MSLFTKRHFRIFRQTTHHPKQFLFRPALFRAIGLIGFFAGLGFAVFGPVFRISQVSCVKQNQENCDEEVVAELASHLGKSAFTLPTKPIQIKLERANPAYQLVNVKVTLPNRLEVTMIDVDIYTHLKSASDSATLVADRNLLVVNKSVTPSPGTFTILAASAGDFGVGDVINDEILVKIFALGQQLKKLYIPFFTITLVSPAEVVVDLGDGRSAYFTTTRDIPRQVTSLQLILQKATITKEPRVFDMRFNEPVLKY